MQVKQPKKTKRYTQVATHDSSSQHWGVERWLRIAIIAGLFVGLAMSAKLWLSDRQYPLTPVFRFLGPIPPPLDAILYGLLLATLVTMAAVARPAKLIGLFTVLAIVMALFDQSRLQPWFYQYSIMLIALGFYQRRDDREDDHDAAINACRLIVVCTYFWSGLQKTHADFMFRTFAALTSAFTPSLPQFSKPLIQAFGVAAPFVETAIGIGLLLPRFRKYAIFALAGMHGFILLCIGPLGLNVNSVVWPWNIAMVVLAVVLFWNRTNVTAREILWQRGSYFQKVVLLLFGIAPSLSFFDLWDDYLSSALYTEPRNVAVFYMSNKAAGRLPKYILPHVYWTNKSGMTAINASEWSLDELNAQIYPAPRIYKNVARVFCSYAQDPADFKLVITRKRVLFSADKEMSYDCAAVSK